MTFDELKKIFPAATPNTWHQHKNGDGWVQDTATVADSAYVGPDAQVYGNAKVYGNAQVCGNALVCDDAKVYGNAQVYGYALVYGNALVCDDAKVYGNARVYGNALVCDDAKVYGNARVYGNAKVYDNAQVYADARVCDNARVYGDAKVCDDALVYDSEPQNSPTLDHSPKAECITGPYLLLLKAQVLREMRSYFDESQGMDPQYSNYLEGLESATIQAIGDAETLDHYLQESRRITLKEWMDSLDWRHCTMDKK